MSGFLVPRRGRYWLVYSLFFFLPFFFVLFFPSFASAFSVSTSWYTSRWESSGSSGQYASDTTGITAGQATPRASTSNSIGVKGFNVWFTMPSSFNLSGKAGAHFSVTVPLYPSGGTTNSWGCLYPTDITATLSASGVSSTRTAVNCVENHSDPNNVTVNLFAEFDLFPTSGSTFTSNPEINIGFSSSQPFIIFSSIGGVNPNNTYLYFPRSVNIYNDRLYTDPTSAGVSQMVGLQSQTNTLLEQQLQAQLNSTQQQQDQYDAEKQEEADREEAASDSQTGSFLGSFGNLLFPFATVFSDLGTKSCFTPSNLHSWLHTSGQVCPWFSNTVTTTVSSVALGFGSVIIFGFVIKWLNRSEL